MRRERNVASRLAVVLPALAVLGLYVFAAAPSAAEPYPSKLVKFVVPLSPGSPIDVMARVVAPALSTRLGQPVIVENRPGGGSTIGTRAVATSPPDGYTLLFASATHTLGPALVKNLDYDPIVSFAPVATIGSASWVLVVTPSVPAKSIVALVAYAKANPGKLNWGFGRNAGPHLLGELFLLATGISVNKVAYKSGADAVPDMLGGRIDMNFGTVENLRPLVDDGRLRALAVTGEKRSDTLAAVPTMREAGFPRLTRGLWAGLLAPAGTPSEIVSLRLNAEVNASLETPEVQESLHKIGVEPTPGSPETFAALMAEEIEAWKTAAKAAGIEPQ